MRFNFCKVTSLTNEMVRIQIRNLNLDEKQEMVLWKRVELPIRRSENRILTKKQSFKINVVSEYGGAIEIATVVNKIRGMNQGNWSWSYPNVVSGINRHTNKKERDTLVVSSENLFKS